MIRGFVDAEEIKSPDNVDAENLHAAIRRVENDKRSTVAMKDWARKMQHPAAVQAGVEREAETGNLRTHYHGLTVKEFDRPELQGLDFSQAYVKMTDAMFGAGTKVEMERVHQSYKTDMDNLEAHMKVQGETSDEEQKAQETYLQMTQNAAIIAGETGMDTDKAYAFLVEHKGDVDAALRGFKERVGKGEETFNRAYGNVRNTVFWRDQDIKDRDLFVAYLDAGQPEKAEGLLTGIEEGTFKATLQELMLKRDSGESDAAGPEIERYSVDEIIQMLDTELLQMGQSPLDLSEEDKVRIAEEILNARGNRR